MGIRATWRPDDVGYFNSPRLIVYLLLFSALNRIKCGLQGVLGRVEAAGYTENDEDIHILSELMDDIRDPITNYQVGSTPKL